MLIVCIIFLFLGLCWPISKLFGKDFFSQNLIDNFMCVSAFMYIHNIHIMYVHTVHLSIQSLWRPEEDREFPEARDIGICEPCGCWECRFSGSTSALDH